MQDLTKLNRDPSRVIYLSGHAVDSSLQPENSLPIMPWKLEADDTGLLDLLPFLECKISYRRSFVNEANVHNASIFLMHVITSLF